MRVAKSGAQLPLPILFRAARSAHTASVSSKWYNTLVSWQKLWQEAEDTAELDRTCENALYAMCGQGVAVQRHSCTAEKQGRGCTCLETVVLSSPVASVEHGDFTVTVLRLHARSHEAQGNPQ